MAEMHLDLCIQSTNHLLETVSSIKEHIRILDVFLNSGLSTVFYRRDFSKPIGFQSDDYSSSGEGQRSVGTDGRFCHLNGIPNVKNSIQHANCCCMCHFRIQGLKKENTLLERSLSSSRASGVVNSQNTNKKTFSAPLTPRLNKTASLRRERILQRFSRKNSFM